MDPPKSALPTAVSPTGNYGVASTTAQSIGSIGSSVKRRAEVHSRHQSDQSISNSTSSDRLRRASAKYQARRSNPQLSQEDIVPLPKQQQTEPLTIKKLASISRKPIQGLIQRSETRNSVTDQKPKSFSSKLLTEVSEEDIIRRHRSRGGSSNHYPSFSESSKPLHLSIPDRGAELQERPSPWLASPSNFDKHQDSPTLSLFNLEPLAITKSSPAQTIDTGFSTALTGTPELQAVTDPSTPSKNPRPYSLYKPDLFSTFRGIPLQTTTAQAGSQPVQTHVTVSITSPTPQKPTRRATTSNHSNSRHSTPTRSASHYPLSPKTIRHSYSPKSHIPIASRYITALVTSTKEDPNFTLQLRRQASIARLRAPATSPRLSPTQPLTQWLTNLCTTNNTTMPPSEISGTKSDSRRQERDRFQSPAFDDESIDEEGVQKAKPTASEELGVMIDDMLNDLTGKFTAITSEIMAKMDDMGRRIDNLEASLQRDGEKVPDEDAGTS